MTKNVETCALSRQGCVECEKANSYHQEVTELSAGPASTVWPAYAVTFRGNKMSKTFSSAYIRPITRSWGEGEWYPPNTMHIITCKLLRKPRNFSFYETNIFVLNTGNFLLIKIWHFFYFFYLFSLTRSITNCFVTCFWS